VGDARPRPGRCDKSRCIIVGPVKNSLAAAKETAIANKPKASFRDSISAIFTHVEDAIYIGLALLLAAVAGTLLIAEIILFTQYLLAGNLSDNIVLLLDRILLIIIFVEVLYTVQVSFRQHVLQPGPFLVVGLIAVTRRILVLTAELPKIIKEDSELFRNSIIELALLTVLIVALVVSIHFLRPRNPTAAEEGAPKKE
jgi:uncharacterized membrane protein (DUF373 family)